MSNTVLAVIESDRFPEEVTTRAAWIAKMFGCELELLYSDPTLGFLKDSFMVSTDAQQLSAGITEAQEIVLKGLADSVASEGLTIRTSVTHERPAADAIVAKAIEREPLFVVKGTTYHSPAERATFKFTDWQLIRKLDYPLWLVKPHEWQEKPTIVAAVDPMHRHDKEGVLANAIVQSGKDVAARCEGELMLLHTYQRLAEIGGYVKLKFKPSKAPIDEIEETMRSEHRRHLDSLAAKHEVAPDAIHQLPGRTPEVLPTFVRAHKADLVVMGALARTGLKRRVIGSTAEQVLDHLPCDILIARGHQA